LVDCLRVYDHSAITILDYSPRILFKMRLNLLPSGLYRRLWNFTKSCAFCARGLYHRLGLENIIFSPDPEGLLLNCVYIFYSILPANKPPNVEAALLPKVVLLDYIVQLLLDNVDESDSLLVGLMGLVHLLSV